MSRPLRHVRLVQEVLLSEAVVQIPVPKNLQCVSYNAETHHGANRGRSRDYDDHNHHHHHYNHHHHNNHNHNHHHNNNNYHYYNHHHYYYKDHTKGTVQEPLGADSLQ